MTILATMTKKLILPILLFFSSISFSQIDKAKVLSADDPIIGNWKFDAVASGSESPAPILDSEEFIKFLPGDQLSGFACCYFEDNGYACPSDFVAKKDGNFIYGNLTRTCIMMLQSQDFKFEFRYDEKTDKLIVIVEGEEYIYSRYKP